MTWTWAWQVIWTCEGMWTNFVLDLAEEAIPAWRWQSLEESCLASLASGSAGSVSGPAQCWPASWRWSSSWPPSKQGQARAKIWIEKSTFIYTPPLFRHHIQSVAEALVREDRQTSDRDQSSSEGDDNRRKITFQDYLYYKFYPESYNGTWYSDHEIKYLGPVSVHENG